MKRLFVLSLLVASMLFMVGCSKTASLEGKVVDGKGQPLASVKVMAKMSQPIKGYEQFETTTGSDGAFKFKKLFPTSEYQLIFSSDRWTMEKKMKMESGPEGQTKILPEPMMVRFMDDSKKGVVLDTKTGLMWAARDNGGRINWFGAKNYCENYRGGGYTDWRMPTHNELKGLYEAKWHEAGIHLTVGGSLWASDAKDGWASTFFFNSNSVSWCRDPMVNAVNTALPVRSAK